VDVIQIAVTAAITSLMSGVVGAVVATVVSLAKDKKRGVTEDAKAQREGVRALLWRELKTLRAEAIEQGGMNIEQRRHLERVYKAYHGLGGNGTGTRLYEEAMQQPVID